MLNTTLLRLTKFRKSAQKSSLLLSSFIIGVALAVPPTQLMADEVNVYSARKTQLIKPLLDEFSKETGITVNLITSDADALLKKLESEGRRSPADILITTDAGRLHRAKEVDVLQQAISDSAKQKVPAHLQDTDGYWIALTTRARVIVYDKEKVQPSELSTYEDLTDPKWKGKGIESAGKIVKYLEDNDGSAECFPYDEI